MPCFLVGVVGVLVAGVGVLVADVHVGVLVTKKPVVWLLSDCKASTHKRDSVKLFS